MEFYSGGCIGWSNPLWFVCLDRHYVYRRHEDTIVVELYASAVLLDC
jgi:hypothetical protein